MANMTWMSLTAKEVAERSILIKNMLEDCVDIDQAIPIPNVRLASFSVFYMKHWNLRFC